MVALRRRILPPKSRREAVARALYVPILARLQKSEEERRRALEAQVPMSARVVHVRGPAVGALPPVPRILILKLDHLGDFLLGLRAIERLREGFPTASFTMVCGPWNIPWAEQAGGFERIVPFDFFPSNSGDWDGANDALFNAFAALELGRFDIAIDLRHDVDTRKLLGLVDTDYRAGFCAPAKIGGDKLDLALPGVERISLEDGTGTPFRAEQRLIALADAVIEVFRPPQSHPVRQLVMPRKLPPELRALTERPFIVMAVGTGAAIKTWSVERFAQVGQRLLDRHEDATLVLIGGPRDAPAGAFVAATLPADRVMDVTGKVDLVAMPALLDRALMFVGGDTGMTHLAAMLGTPTVVVFSGSTNLGVWRPIGPHVAIVAGHTICSPCHLTKLEQCPYHVACLDVIKVGDVLDACDAVVQARGVLLPA
jgi:ADP-heptose:LPS heptosyltransferase